jgi:serine/threonine protein kinase
MSLETIQKGVYSEASDVWSYAITAWEIVNRGSTPYGKNVKNIDCVKKVIKGYRLEFHDGNVPDRVGDLLEAATLANPQERPTFEDFVTAFAEQGQNDVIYASLSTFQDADQTGTNGADFGMFRESNMAAVPEGEYHNRMAAVPEGEYHNRV